MRSQVTSLVQQVVNEYFQAQEQEKKTDTNMFILLANPSPNKQAVWDHIRSLDLKHHISLGVTNEWKDKPQQLTSIATRHIDEMDRYELLAELNEADVLYVPVISYGLVAKMALTIDDDLLAWLLIQSQFNGKNILFSSDVFQENGPHLHVNRSIKKRVDSYWRQLREDGIEVSLMAHVGEKIAKINRQTMKKTLLLAKHIETLSNNKEETVIIPKNSLITPLAKDRARELGITIQQEGYEKRNRI